MAAAFKIEFPNFRSCNLPASTVSVYELHCAGVVVAVLIVWWLN